VELVPNLFSSHSNLGIALTGQGKLDEAIKHLKIAVKLNPGDQEIQKLLQATMAKSKETP